MWWYWVTLGMTTKRALITTAMTTFLVTITMKTSMDKLQPLMLYPSLQKLNPIMTIVTSTHLRYQWLLHQKDIVDSSPIDWLEFQTILNLMGKAFMTMMSLWVLLYIIWPCMTKSATKRTKKMSNWIHSLLDIPSCSMELIHQELIVTSTKMTTLFSTLRYFNMPFSSLS